MPGELVFALVFAFSRHAFAGAPLARPAAFAQPRPLVEQLAALNYLQTNERFYRWLSGQGLETANLSKKMELYPEAIERFFLIRVEPYTRDQTYALFVSPRIHQDQPLMRGFLATLPNRPPMRLLEAQENAIRDWIPEEAYFLDDDPDPTFIDGAVIGESFQWYVLPNGMVLRDKGRAGRANRYGAFLFQDPDTQLLNYARFGLPQARLLDPQDPCALSREELLKRSGPCLPWPARK